MAAGLVCWGFIAIANGADLPKAEPSLPPTADRKIDFAGDIEPLLAAKCLRCHGPDEQEGGLRLDAREIVLKGGQSGPLFVRGNSADSRLVRRMAGLGDEDQMPPDDEPMSDEQIGLVRAWIDQGAVWPDGIGSDAREVERHWAYVGPERPALPALDDPQWCRNPIDHFVLSRLEKESLRPSPEADRARLIRRLYLDLVGLPPPIHEVNRFLADLSPAAYDSAVERLLASPQYGVRWARQWLDLARYADSNGYQADQFRDVWPYRDWVIRAMNRDMPFDQFTVEQIAGDLLPDATLDQKIATGFHRSTTCNVEAGVDPEENRVNQVIDRVNVTGTVWLGTTVECCQCHNHKYDPFTQEDYYRLFSYFNSTPLEVKLAKDTQYDFVGPKMALPMRESKVIRRRQLEDRRATLKAELDKQLAEADAEPKHPDVAKMRNELAALKKEIEATEPFTTLVMVELDQPRETNLLKRGNFLTPGEAVAPGTPKMLHPLPADAPPNRLGLARWLIDPENPLVGRAVVNRWWAELFGAGLVASLEDLGTQCEPPTHPQLLDWLAVEMVESGWSMKHIHRLMVTSATYRQSSRVTPQLLERDPYNKLLARGPRFRLPAESIRDNALAVSGLLSRKMGGPPVFPPQPEGVWRHVGRNAPVFETSRNDDRFRRGVYVVWRRSAPYPSFVNFDAPDRAAACVKRPRTNTPLQALTLLNDPAYVEMTRALARRILTDHPDMTIRDRVVYGFRLCVARHPKTSEAEHLERVFEHELARFKAAPDAAQALLGGAAEAPDAESAELAAWFYVANILLNLDETITKG